MGGSRITVSQEADGDYLAEIADLRHSETGKSRAEALSRAEDYERRETEQWVRDVQANRMARRPPLHADYSERLVAYIDILGFKELTKKNGTEAERWLDKVDGHLRWSPRSFDEWIDAGFAVKLVTDAICISCLRDRLSLMLYELARLQLAMSMDRLFIRGGLAYGRHYQNDVVLFSEGQVRAYELEQKAEYPRILIAEEVAAEAEGKQDMDIQYLIPGYRYVKESPDGCKFVDYLEHIQAQTSDVREHQEGLRRHRTNILAGAHENRHNPKTVDKYRWLAEYHNWKCTELGEPNGDARIRWDSERPWFRRTSNEQ